MTFFKRICVFLLIVGFVFGIIPIQKYKGFEPTKVHAADPWWNNSWTKRMKITFANGSRGALTDFPVQVALNSGRVTYGNFKAGGADIRFVDADGSTLLNYEIEKWDTSGTSTLWVKIPQIDSASDTDYIYMYYGNSGASAVATTTGVWDSSYVTVQHWGEDPTGAAPQFQDSTVNNKDGTASSSQVGGPVVATTLSGKFGSGLDFNGNTHLVDEGETQLAPLPNGSAEFWFDIDTMAASSTNRYLFSRVKSGSNDGELRVYVDTTSGSVNRDKIVFQIECTVPSSISPIATSTASTTIDSWYHVTAVWDDDTAGAMKLYVNGTQVGYSNTTTCGSEATAVVTMAGKNNALNNGYFDGQMDELRVSSVARSADWINASYVSGVDGLNTYAGVENQPDAVPPVVSSIASSTTDTTATITWTTDESATSTVNYGLTTSYGSASSSNTGTTNHSIQLTGLTQSTTYNFQISVWDTSSNLATSSNLTFTTTAATPPGQPTSVTVYPYDNRAHLRWTASTGTVTDYKIEYKLSSEPTTWTLFNDGVSTATTTMVTGLTNNVAYDFRITGTNGGSDGTVSATVSTTPSYLMTFVNPTIANGNSTTSTTITASASTTSGLTPSYFTFRLETSGGSLVSNSTTTTRWGDFSLNHVTELSHKVNLGITGDLSGQVYVPTTDTLFTVHNNQNIISEVTRSGSLVRTITCSSCNDIEDITLVSSVASTTAGGYDHTFMISTEDVDINNLQIFRVVIHSTGAVTVNRNDYFSTGIAASSTNDGLEGIAYNANTDTYFVSVEGQATQTTRPRLYEVTLGSGHSATSVPVCTNINFRDYLTEDNTVPYGNTSYADISGLDFSTSTNRLYVISHKADKILEVDVANRNSCSVLNQLPIAMRADSGANHDFEMPEGVAWDATGDYMYVSAEASYWSVWRTNTYTVQKTFTGLTPGTYNLYTSVTDAFGNTSTTTARSFTVFTPDTTAPVISNIASSTTDTTATVTWDTNENASSSVRYGTSPGVYTGISSSTADLSHSATLTGLSRDTTYYFSVLARDPSGNVSTSTERSFKTQVSGSPVVTVQAASSISTSSATLNATLVDDGNASTTSWGFEYGPTTSYGTIVSVGGFIPNGTPYYISITGLNPATTYYFRGVVTTTFGTASSSGTSFVTASITPDTPPVIGPVGGSSGGGGGAGAQQPQQQNNNQQPQPQNNKPEPNTPAEALQNLGAQGVVIKNIQAPGKKNLDVKNIQKILNADKATQIAKKGPGSPGKETNLYGAATKAAVGKFQIKHGILKSPKDKGYGIVGPATRKKMNELVKEGR